jgi:hypothetical protein
MTRHLDEPCRTDLTADQRARRVELLCLPRLRISIALKGDVADEAAALGRPLPAARDLTDQEWRYAETMVTDPARVGAQFVELSALLPRMA